MKPRRRIPRALTVSLIAIIGLVLNAWTVWPGLMSPDSFGQLDQARRNSYFAWHPPLMAWTWHWTDRVYRGPAGLLLIELILLWTGLAVIAVLALRRTRWGWLALAIGFLPPVYVLAGHLWKDTLMSAALTAAVALLALARDAKKPMAAVGALLLLFYATGIRYNANTAVLPLAATAVWILLARYREKPSAMIAIFGGVMLTALFMNINTRISLRLCDGVPVPPTQCNFVHDIVGFSKATGEKLLPESWRAEYAFTTEERLRELYRPDSSDPIVYDGNIKPTLKTNIVADLRRVWLRQVLRHPLMWLRNRGELFRLLNGVGSEPVHYPWHWTEDPNTLGVTWHHSKLKAKYTSMINDVVVPHTPLFRGWLYILFACGVLVYAYRRRRIDALTAGVAASLFLYWLPLGMFAPATDFRYLFWPILASLILPLVLRPMPAVSVRDGTSGGAAAQA